MRSKESRIRLAGLVGVLFARLVVCVGHAGARSLTADHQYDLQTT